MLSKLDLGRTLRQLLLQFLRAFLWAGLVLAGSSGLTQAQAPPPITLPKSITVVMDDNYPPFTFEKEFRRSMPLYTGQFHRAVRKGNGALLKVVEDGFERISATERQTIARKWYGAEIDGPGLSTYAWYAVDALLGLVVLALGLALWNLSLRRRVRTKTAELSSSLAALSHEKRLVDQTLAQINATQKALRASELEFRATFEQAAVGISHVALGGHWLRVNQRLCDIVGYTREELLAHRYQDVTHPDDLQNNDELERQLLTLAVPTYSIEKRYLHKNGKIVWVRPTVSLVRKSTGEPDYFISVIEDITALKEHQNQLEYIAHFDALTKLPNRLLLADRLQQGLSQVARRGLTLAVAYIDLDGFKAINDLYGHEIGDRLLIAIALHMKQTLREGDTLARLGGDEFVAVLMDLEDVAASVPMLTRLLAAAAQAVPVDGLILQVSASLGVTFYPQAQDIDADHLLRQADQAMYQAKMAGKNRYHIFDAVQDSSLRIHHESLERIRLALDQHEFVLFYQPKVNLRSGQVIGAEALIRWQHPERGLLAPALFLPVIEDHPLAVLVGEWVLDSALTQIEIWRAAGLDLPVSVNVGARQLQQADFCDRLQALLATHPKVKPGCLELEILETSALQDIAQVSQVIDACAQIGVTFALDDFGTGYSSLTYLKRLHVALLKIDQSFVRDMLDDPDDLAILEGVIGLAAAFKREVIAEGVETVAHGSLLLQLGCDLAQGYGIARPMPAAEMPMWAATWRPDPAWSGKV